MGRKTKYILIIAATLALIFVCGCKEKAKTVILSNGNEYVWEEGPLKAVEIPAETEFVQSWQLKVDWTSEPGITNDGVWKRIVTQGTDGTYPSYLIHYSFEKQQWELFEAGSNKSEDGVEYGWIGENFCSLKGECAVTLKNETGSTYIANMGESSVGKTLFSFEPVTRISSLKYCLGKNENLWAWDVQTQSSLFTTDLRSQTTLLHSFNPTGDVSVEGYILGATQKDAESGVLFYGVDRNREPAMWDENGKAVLCMFPLDMSATEYHVTFDNTGSMYFVDKYSIWENENNSINKILSFMENGYSFSSCEGISCQNGEILRVLMKNGDDLTVISYDFSRKDVSMEKAEVVLALPMSNPALESVIADFNRYNQEYYVSVRTPEIGDEVEDYKRKIQMEISAGKGPDIIEGELLHDANTMISKGFILELDKEAFADKGMIKSALETGVYNDSLYSVPYQFGLDYVVYPREIVGNASSVSVDDLIKYMSLSGRKYLEAEGREVSIIIRFGLYDESNTDYIDWEKGISKLKEDKFKELVEFAGRVSIEYDDYSENEKDSFVYRPWYGFFSLDCLNEAQNMLGECAYLGYPRKSGKGIYMSTDRMYVNSRSANSAGAKAFLDYLVSERAQAFYVSYDESSDLQRKAASGGIIQIRSAGLPVNRTVLEAAVQKNNGNNEENQFIMDNGKVLYLRQPIADDLIDSFYTMTDNALPANFRITDIEDIFYEELNPYFAGETDLDSALDKLDNRVSLYLYENY